MDEDTVYEIELLKHSDSYEAGNFSGPEKGFKRENINVCQVTDICLSINH
jgi:hypothetical protein